MVRASGDVSARRIGDTGGVRLGDPGGVRSRPPPRLNTAVRSPRAHALVARSNPRRSDTARLATFAKGAAARLSSVCVFSVAVNKDTVAVFASLSANDTSSAHRIGDLNCSNRSSVEYTKPRVQSKMALPTALKSPWRKSCSLSAWSMTSPSMDVTFVNAGEGAGISVEAPRLVHACALDDGCACVSLGSMPRRERSHPATLLPPVIAFPGDHGAGIEAVLSMPPSSRVVGRSEVR